MTRNHKLSSDHSVAIIPSQPIISDTMHRDTLNHVSHLIELLDQIDLSEEITPGAQTGFYWIHRMIIDALRHVSNDLK